MDAGLCVDGVHASAVRPRVARALARIPADTDVLVTHGPPRGILDRNYSGDRIGDKAPSKRVEVVRPRLHLFGHVHDNNGRMERFGTAFINAAIGDNDQDPALSDRIHVVEVLS